MSDSLSFQVREDKLFSSGSDESGDSFRMLTPNDGGKGRKTGQSGRVEGKGRDSNRVSCFSSAVRCHGFESAQIGVGGRFGVHGLTELRCYTATDSRQRTEKRGG